MNNQKTTTTTTKSTKNIYIYIRQIDYAHEKRPYGLFLNKDHTSQKYDVTWRTFSIPLKSLSSLNESAKIYFLHRF